jgi:hypothetical protein
MAGECIYLSSSTWTVNKVKARYWNRIQKAALLSAFGYEWRTDDQHDDYFHSGDGWCGSN